MGRVSGGGRVSRARGRVVGGRTWVQSERGWGEGERQMRECGGVCACDCSVCEPASWRLSLIVLYGHSEPGCPGLGSSFLEHLVPGSLGSSMRRGYRSLFQWHYHLLALWPPPIISWHGHEFPNFSSIWLAFHPSLGFWELTKTDLCIAQTLVKYC